MKKTYSFISFLIFFGYITNTHSQELTIKRISDEKSFFEALGDNTKIIITTDKLLSL